MSSNHDFVVKNGLAVGTNISATGTITTAGQTFPASDGSSGQTITTDGSGALSWTTIVSGGFTAAGDSGSDAIGGSETITFTGGTNITTAVTANTVTITNDLSTSDNLTEGSSNLYYTDTRAVNAIEGHAHLTIDGGTLYVDTAANRVGISDTSPSQKLDIAGNVGINGTEIINASGQYVGPVTNAALTIGGSLAGDLSNVKVQYASSYAGTPIQGSFFFDSLNQKMKVYTGSAFVDAVPAGGGGGGGGSTDANTTFRDYRYTLGSTTNSVSGVDDVTLTAGAFISGHKYTIVTAGNTSFTGIGATNNNVGTVFVSTGVGTGTGTAKRTLFYDTTSSSTSIVVYVNGIKQVNGSSNDFVSTTGTSVAFTYNVPAASVVEVQVYELLTNSAYYLKGQTLSTAQINTNIATAVPLSGGTMTGGLHIRTADAGTVTASTQADDLVVENSAEGGITIMTPDAQSARIRFTSPSTNNDVGGASIFYRQNINKMNIGTSVSGGILQLQSGAGAETMTLIANGKVGIGTASPAELLDVTGTGTPTLAIHNSGGSGNSTLHIGESNMSSYGTEIRWEGNLGNTFFDNRYNHSTRPHMYFRMRVAGSPITAMTIDPAGNVGIGATNPDSPVTIQPFAQGVGTNSVQSWMYALTSGSEFDLKLNQVVSSGLVKYAFTLRNNGTSYANNLVLDRGNVGIGTASPTAKLHIQVADGAEFLKATIIGNEAWAFKGASGSGSMDYVSFGISGGTQAIAWQENGNTGIGTTAPGARLSVSGPAALANLGGGSTGSAALYVNTTSGHTGEIIQILKNGSTQLHMANDGKVGIGTSSPLSKLHVHQSGTGSVPVTVANFVTNSNAYGRGPRLDFSVLWGSNLQTAQIAAPNVTGGGGYGGDLSFSTNGQANNTMTERLRLNANGKVEVSGHFKSKDNVSVTHPGSSSGTEYKLTNKAYIGGKVLIPFQVYFPNGVSNLAIRLYTRPTSLWVSGEVTFGSTYSNANAHGFRRYTFTHNFNTTSSYGTGLTNTENVGSNSSHFEFSSHGYDSGEGAHYFEFRHLSSSGNAIYGQLEFHGSAPGYQDNDWYFRCTTY